MLDPALGESWQELGIDVLQGYGTTEASPALTFNRVELNRLGSVGTPLPGVEVKVAEDGEVLARGPNIFKGYWENEDATRAVLDKEGWYHTGDLGSFDSDGFLTLRGRKKDMIVLADGTKVYPEDIETRSRPTPGSKRSRSRSGPRSRPSSACSDRARTPGYTACPPEGPRADHGHRSDANTQLSAASMIRGWTIWR